MVWTRRAVKTVILDIQGTLTSMRTRLLCPALESLTRQEAGGSGVGPGPWQPPETLEPGRWRDLSGGRSRKALLSPAHEIPGALDVS